MTGFPIRRYDGNSNVPIRYTPDQRAFRLPSSLSSGSRSAGLYQNMLSRMTKTCSPTYSVSLTNTIDPLMQILPEHAQIAFLLELYLHTLSYTNANVVEETCDTYVSTISKHCYDENKQPKQMSSQATLENIAIETKKFNLAKPKATTKNEQDLAEIQKLEQELTTLLDQILLPRTALNTKATALPKIQSSNTPKSKEKIETPFIIREPKKLEKEIEISAASSNKKTGNKNSQDIASQSATKEAKKRKAAQEMEGNKQAFEASKKRKAEEENKNKPSQPQQ